MPLDNPVIVDGLIVSDWSREVFEEMRDGGLTAANCTCAVWHNFRETMDNIAAWQGFFRDHADILVQARSVADIRAAREEGRVAVFLGWQNSYPIEDRVDYLPLFHDLGVRVIQLTYNERNLLGNGCYERSDDGLSHFGRDAVREMNRLGILIDLSHVGDRTTLEAIERSERPVAITHANARAFFDHVRNKTDAALQLLAERGGVIGANAFPSFLRRGFQSTIADYVDAIEDLIERVGIDHVGIGTDYTQDQPATFFDWLFAQQGTKRGVRGEPFPDPLIHPQGMETPDTLSNVTGELLRRGYRPEDVTKVMGGNWLRLFRAVWDA